MIQTQITPTVESCRFEWRPRMDIEYAEQWRTHRLAAHDREIEREVESGCDPSRFQELKSNLLAATPEVILDKISDQYAKLTDDRWERWLNVSIGTRFYDCDIDNYEIYHDRQAEAVEQLKAFRHDLPRHLSAGRNLVLFGSCGGGKDHVMAWLLRTVIMEILQQPWINWQIGLNGTINREYPPDLLAISDLCLTGQQLRYADQRAAYDLIDDQYRNERSTWITLNCEDRDQMDEMLGPQIADRLVDNAVSVFFDWPSFRKAAENREFAPRQTARLRYPLAKDQAIDPGPSRKPRDPLWIP